MNDTEAVLLIVIVALASASVVLLIALYVVYKMHGSSFMQEDLALDSIQNQKNSIFIEREEDYYDSSPPGSSQPL